ncbi:MAG: septum formation initiator family protein [Pseudomonadota bacterium]|nr:septum formation initiator family protein [Pseudomonadota bacterium]
MSLIKEIRRRGRDIAGSIFGALLFFYFVLHAIQGDRGLLAWLEIRHQITKASFEHSKSEQLLKIRQQRIAMLSDEQIDTDLLEERVGIITGLKDPKDVFLKFK